MKTTHGRTIGLAIALLASTGALAETAQLGSIKFLTDVKVFKFTGEVKDMTSTVTRTKGAISSFELRIPVKSIKTGMDVRDKHMQERVFEDDKKAFPDLVYKSTKVDCKAGTDANLQTCQVTGDMTIRGETKPLPLTFALKNGKEVSGKVVIDVLQFGVTPEKLKYSALKASNLVDLDFEVKLQ